MKCWFSSFLFLFILLSGDSSFQKNLLMLCAYSASSFQGGRINHHFSGKVGVRSWCCGAPLTSLQKWDTHHSSRGYDKSRCDPLGADRKSGRLSQQWFSYSGKTLGTLLFQFQKWRKKVFNTIGLVSKPYF